MNKKWYLVLNLAVHLGTTILEGLCTRAIKTCGKMDAQLHAFLIKAVHESSELHPAQSVCVGPRAIELRFLSLVQGCTHPGRHVAVTTKFCTVAPNICGPSV